MPQYKENVSFTLREQQLKETKELTKNVSQCLIEIKKFVEKLDVVQQMYERDETIQRFEEKRRKLERSYEDFWTVFLEIKPIIDNLIKDME